MASSKDAGDRSRLRGASIDATSDGTGSKGELVKISSGKVTPTTAAGDAIYGVLGEDSPADGEQVQVYVMGTIYVNIDGSVTEGDVLEASGNHNGHASSSSDSLVTAVDEGGTATYNIYSRVLVACEDGSDEDIIEAHLG